MAFRSIFMTVRRIFMLCALLITAATLPAKAQEHSYVHYDVKDGLAGSSVYSMAQDKDGFIWFGTETGLSRFDGTHFKNFTTRDGLPDNEILKIFVDSKNRVWVAPFKNTVAYYYHGRFHTQQNDSLLRRLPITSAVGAISENPAGAIMIMQGKSLCIIDTGGRITVIKPDDYLAGYFMQIGPAVSGNFRAMINPDDGISFANIIGKKMFPGRTFCTSTMNSSLFSYIGPDLEICKTNDSILFYFPIDKKEYKLVNLRGMISLSRVNENNVVIATAYNNYLFDIRQKKITDSFLKGQTVNSVIEDAEGDLWFSTLGRGVYRCVISAVGNYFFKLNNERVPVFSINEIDSVLYMGGDHFLLNSLNLRNGEIKSRQLTDTITRGRIMSFIRMNSKSFLAGTDFGYLIAGEGPRTKYPDIFLSESIKSVQLTYDTLLLSASNIMVKQSRLPDIKDLDTLWTGRATWAYKARDASFYIGTLNGLYSVRKGQPPLFLGDRFKVLASRIGCIGGFRDGTIWVATDGEGIVGLRNGQLTTHLTENDGLTSNICRTLFVDNDKLWVGTDKGLNKIVPTGSSYTITSYTTADGLNSDMINTVYADNNDVYVGTPEGLTYFNENKISKRSECSLHITGVQVSDKQWPADSNGFVLPHAENNIKFDFVGISFKSAGNIDYQYKLTGLDTAWKTTQETFLSYPSLPSGKYELQLIAINKFGVQSRQASILFTVDKLIWEKWWFRLLVVGAIAAGVFLAFNYRVRLVKKKEAEKTEINTKMAELEQMALRSQMNPHFIFNCLNSIQQYVIYRDVLGANEFITKFSYLIRQTLDLSTKQTISLHEEINYIETYMSLEKKRFDNKFIYDIVVGPEVDRDSCHILPMILQPYIENAVRHGIGPRKDKNGRLLVKMQYQEGFLACIVEDNGVGRKLARQYKSINSIAYQSVGMSLVAKRIEMINKTSRRPVEICIDDMEDNEGIALGTRIRILFPLETVLDINH